jgi:hypothetical protein
MNCLTTLRSSPPKGCECDWESQDCMGEGFLLGLLHLLLGSGFRRGRVRGRGLAHSLIHSLTHSLQV